MNFINSPKGATLATLAAALVATIAISVGNIMDTREARADNISIPPILNAEGQKFPGSMAYQEKVILGGVEQWILIRSQNPENPVLLYLHGGPGGAVMPWVDLFHTPLLEENFTVVHWDQRGSGKSFNTDLTVSDVAPEKFISDTLELSNVLRERFGKDKIFLTGQSWGSALGFMTIAKDSSPYHAFIPTSERVEWNKSMKMGFDWVVERAEANGDSDVLAQLEAIKPFDAMDEDDLIVQRKALVFYRAGDYHTEGLQKKYMEYAIGGKSPYYSDADVQKYMPGMALSSQGVEVPEIIGNYDLFASHPSVDIPIHFITGAQDYNTPAKLAREYYEFIKAPAKSFTEIEGAAHMVLFDQPEAWAKALVNIKNITLKNETR